MFKLPDQVRAEMRASPVQWFAQHELALERMLRAGASVDQVAEHVRRVGRIHHMLRVRRDPIRREAMAA